MIFREAGNYEVAVTVTNGVKEYTETLAFVIVKDMEPYAGFTLVAEKYQRDSAGVAEVLLTNTSYSVDNDVLGSSVYPGQSGIHRDLRKRFIIPCPL